jgi:hypothetical protein
MIKFDPDKSKTLRLQITESSNMDTSTMRAYARLKTKRVEYCFPVDVVNEFLVATIPPLSGFDIPEGTENTVDIEVISEDSYIVPFSDSFEVERKVKLEAKMVGSSDATAEAKSDRPKMVLLDEVTPGPEETEETPKRERLSIQEQFLNA